MFAAIATGTLPLHQCVWFENRLLRNALCFLHGANFATHIAYMRYDLLMHKVVAEFLICFEVVLAQCLPLMFASIR